MASSEANPTNGSLLFTPNECTAVECIQRYVFLVPKIQDFLFASTTDLGKLIQ